MFEAQEDQSETSQQTAASDEEHGTTKQVLTSVTADKKKWRLVFWQQSGQFPSVTVNQWLQTWLLRMSYVLCFHFPFSMDSSGDFFSFLFFWSADWARTVVSSLGLIVKWVTRNKAILPCFLRGPSKSARTSHTPQYFIAHKETAGALPLSRYSGKWNERNNMRNTN